MIGIIGGSGFYSFIENGTENIMDTPFGSAKYIIGHVDGNDICFVPRHGVNHSVSPSQINYRANIFAFFKLGVEYIIATNAVGSTDISIQPGSLAVPDGIIDFTHGRASTFFDGSDFEVEINGEKLTGVVHTDVSNVFDNELRDKIIKAGVEYNKEIMNGGVIGVSNGPRFESPAEIKMYRNMGVDFVGMTTAPEAFLAKELRIPYATLAVVTNLGAGLQKNVSAEEVFDLFSKNIELIKSIFRKVISS